MIHKRSGNDGLLYSLEEPLVQVYLQYIEVVYNLLAYLLFLLSSISNTIEISTYSVWFRLPKPH